jgi:hypothetical protein
MGLLSHDKMFGGPIDKKIGSALIGLVVLVQVVSLGASMLEIFTGITAFTLVKVSNDLSGLAVALLVALIWFILCFPYSMRINKLLAHKIGGQGVMLGGFLPVPAAASVGLLLFMTGTFVSEAEVPGVFLTAAPFGNPSNSKWVPGLRCRANAVEDADYLNEWGSRLDRRMPVTNPITRILDKIQGNPMTESERHSVSACFSGGNPAVPSDFESSAVVSGGKDLCPCEDGDTQCKLEKPACNLKSPVGENKVCLYSCVGWNAFQLRDVLSNSGSITAGAAIVVAVTSWLSSHFGWTMVRPDTDPQELMRIFDWVDPKNDFITSFETSRESYTVTALPIVLLYGALKLYWVTELDADGYFTVDYYVTFVLLFSSLIVMMLRVWNPFKQTPTLYTEKIWTTGLDEFVVPSDDFEKAGGYLSKGCVKVKDVGGGGTDAEGKHKGLVVININLYQWMKLDLADQCNLLMSYIRKPTEADSEPGAKVELLEDVETSKEEEKEVTVKGCRMKLKVQRVITIPAKDKEGRKTVCEITKWQDFDTALITATFDVGGSPVTEFDVPLDSCHLIEVDGQQITVNKWEPLSERVDKMFPHLKTRGL